MPHNMMLAICMVAFTANSTLRADEQYLGREAAVASDRHLDPRGNRNVEQDVEAAREILRQRGSILEGRKQLQDWPHDSSEQHERSILQPSASPALPQRPQPQFQQLSHRDSSQPVTKVSALREAAWQLDTTANRLEHLDLYEQADALREVAGRMRRDARKIKQSEASMPRAARQRGTYQAASDNG